MTAVEWLVSQLNKEGFAQVVTDKELEQAKELEKQQITTAFVDGRNVGSKDHPGVDGNYYYEQVYK